MLDAGTAVEMTPRELEEAAAATAVPAPRRRGLSAASFSSAGADAAEPLSHDGGVRPECAEDDALWRHAILRVAIIAFFFNFVPSEPFLTKFLVEEKGISVVALDSRVWPTDTYANLVFLLPVGFTAEFLGYTRTILLGLVARQCTRALLVFGEGVPAMMLMQVTYAFSSACNTVFFAFALLVVPEKWRTAASASVFAAYHLGNVVGSALGQFLVDTGLKRLRSLFILSWIIQVVAFALFVALVPRRFHADQHSLGNILRAHGLCGVIRETISIYREMSLMGLLWTVFWVCGSASSFIFGNWYQELVLLLNPSAKFGLVEIAIELAQTVGAILALPFSYALLRHVAPRLARLTVAFIGVALFILDTCILSATTGTFASLSIAGRMFVFGLAQATAQPTIAASLTRPYLALVFAFNTLLALLATTVLTLFGTNQDWAVEHWLDAVRGLSMAMILLGVAGAVVGPFCMLSDYVSK